MAKIKRQISPAQILLIGFTGSIVIGAILLWLPFFHEKGVTLSFADALFTTTSAITVTGLNVIDPGATFNIWGEILLILFIQMGGLGFMTFAIWLLVLMGKKVSLKHRILMKENTGNIKLEGIVKLALNLLWITISVELIGAFLLTFAWYKDLGIKEAFYQGVFHSVSAFNNAGFSLFPDSLMSNVANPLVNIVIILLILLGGIGFVVILDIKNKRFNFRHYSLHTKITLVTNGVLIAIGLFFFFFMEYGNPDSIGSFSIGEKFLSSIFQVVTTRTAGFNTLDISTLTNATLFIFIIYMFIGASSGSTGGGVKVTTFAVIWVSLKSVLQGRKDVVIYERRLTLDTVLRAMSVIILSMLLIVVVTLLLDITERGAPFLDIFFEVTSAFGTVGLSMGMTSHLSEIGRVLIMITMLVGRLGPLTFGYALTRKKEKEHYKYPEEKIMIG